MSRPSSSSAVSGRRPGIGWIVASNAFPLIWLQTQLRGTALPPFLTGEAKPNDVALIVDCLKVSGAMAVAYGFWAMLALPKTPLIAGGRFGLDCCGVLILGRFLLQWYTRTAGGH